MNADKQKALGDLSRRSPFWVCFIVFLLLTCDYGFRLVNLVNQRQQLSQMLLTQVRNEGALAQAQQLEKRLEALSLDLLQVSQTNAAARQVIQEFNIQWTPGPTSPTPVPATSSQPK